MDFRLSDDQRDLQRSAWDLCRREVTSEVVRAAADAPDGQRPELHKQVADLGWLALGAPESLGGLGLGAVELAVVFEALGYVNAPGPLFTTAALVVPALAALDAAELLGPLLEGSQVATVAFGSQPVCDAHLADAVLLVDDDRCRWYDADQLDLRCLSTVDGTRRLATVTPAGNGRDLGPAAALDRVVTAATAVLAAEMVGGMQWVLDTTVAHVKVREQFGQPIGSFQAVQHRCADMLLQTESARSAAYYAAYACATGTADARRAASVAKAYASDAMDLVVGGGIQLHGGIGFTWAHDLHLHLRRSMVSRSLLGTAAEHRDRVLELTRTGTAP